MATAQAAPPSSPPSQPQRPAAVGAQIAAATATPNGTLGASVVSIAVTAAAAGAVVSAAVNGLRKLSAARAAAIPAILLFNARPRRPGITLAERSPSSRRGVLEQLAADEAEREATFRRRQMVRVRRDLPRALRHPAERKRVGAVSGLVRREWHYNRLRQDAIAVRAAGVADSLNVEEVSPTGARWRLGPPLMHTAGCVYLHGRVLDWDALRRARAIPPLHLRCGCGLDPVDVGVAVPSTAETLALIAQAERLEAS